LRVILRIFYWILAILVMAIAASAWWYIYRPLPQIDGRAALAGLTQEVTVERDLWGVPHIRAASVEDLAEAQGYVMAQDRLWQMDLLRRAARGQLSEILGPRTLLIDEEFRTNGFARSAERDTTLLDPESQKMMEAYSRGVNQFIDQHKKNLPLEFSLLGYEPRPWQPSDSLAISGYMYRTLTDTWERKLNRAKVAERAGADRAKDLFSLEAAMDHFVVGDPKVIDDGSERSAAGTDDEDDDDDIQPDTVLKAGRGAAAGLAATESEPDLTAALAQSIQESLRESNNEIRQGLGSNNWAVSGAHTATGKPLLANDTHLELSIPSIWYQIHLTAPCPARRWWSSATTTVSPGASPTTALMFRIFTSRRSTRPRRMSTG
jgi:penicillin amidase